MEQLKSMKHQLTSIVQEQLSNTQNVDTKELGEAVDMEAIRNAGLRVALDPMYGVSETSLKTILLTARCEVETIHDRHDTLFGGKLPSPTASTLRTLQNYVVEHRCDVGVASDGDADRIGLIDDKGNFLHPNDILIRMLMNLPYPKLP